MLGLILTLSMLFDLGSTAELPKGPMQPLAQEKLTRPVALKDKCSKVVIVEWQSQNKNSLQTSQSEQVLSDVCNTVVDKFYTYTRQNKKYDLVQNVSILIGDSGRRHLNDASSRFYFRSANYEGGQIVPILGYHQRAANHIYIFNQILFQDKNGNWIANPEFKTVWAHELYHALSYQTGLFHKRPGDKEQKEEQAAQKFASLFKW